MAVQAKSQSSQPKVTINRHQAEAQFFVEALGRQVGMEMILIPAGEFMMGSPADELDRYDDEGPQHSVTVPSFFLGKYPVTQAQWQVVAALPEVKRALEPEPSHFKGDQRPVERVSWHEAVEFCERLSLKTNRQYRLPSEAEWEYACRAGTTTPFHFGETITTDLANYRGTDDESLEWSGSYGSGPKGIYRKETTPVGFFGVANAFGLCDLHGNVLEWCADHWHGNYDGAPTDGSAWLTENDNNSHVYRGGSWAFYPRNCRSAYRIGTDPDYQNDVLGFRVACLAPRALR